MRIPVVSENQRTDIVDFNRLAALGVDNLARALSGALLPGPGAIVRGGKVKPTTPASKNVVVEPLMGIDASSQLLLLESEATLAVPNNASGQPRIDLVSVGYVQSNLAAEQRWFWNPTTENEFQQNTVTQRDLLAVPVLTTGTPAASPVAPPTPAGHIALAQIAVAPGFASIIADDITRLNAAGPLAAVTWQGTGMPAALPLTLESPVLEVTTPAKALTFLFAQAYIASVSGFAQQTWHKPLLFEIEEVGGNVVASSSQRVQLGGVLTVFAAGVVVGPKPAATYRVRFREEYADSGGNVGLAWSGIILPGFFGGTPQTPAINVLAAVTL